MKKAVSYLMVLLCALIMALNYQLFVFPNSFAPAGLNGIFTMLQYVTGFKLSYATILVNVPLAIVVYFLVSKPCALRSLVYTLALSGFLMLLDRIDLSAFVYDTANSKLLGPAVGGMISGFCGYYMHRVGACYGGTEFVAKLVHKKNPSVNFFTIILALNVMVAAASYFVYDYKLEPVLLCFVYCYLSSSIRDSRNRKHNSALRCEIITDEPEVLSREIIETLHHTATAVTGTGVYTHQEKTILVCILNPSQLPELTRLVAQYPGSFVTVGQVNTVLGNFRHLNSHNQPEKQFFDSGKNK